MFSFADVWEKAKNQYIYGTDSSFSVAAAQWIDAAEAVKLDGDTAYFSCPSSFQCDMFLRYKEQVVLSLEKALGFKVDISVSCPKEAPVPLYKEKKRCSLPERKQLCNPFQF